MVRRWLNDLRKKLKWENEGDEKVVAKARGEELAQKSKEANKEAEEKLKAVAAALARNATLRAEAKQIKQKEEKQSKVKEKEDLVKEELATKEKIALNATKMEKVEKQKQVEEDKKRKDLEHAAKAIAKEVKRKDELETQQTKAHQQVVELAKKRQEKEDEMAAEKLKKKKLQEQGEKAKLAAAEALAELNKKTQVKAVTDAHNRLVEHVKKEKKRKVEGRALQKKKAKDQEQALKAIQAKQMKANVDLEMASLKRSEMREKEHTLAQMRIEIASKRQDRLLKKQITDQADEEELITSEHKKEAEMDHKEIGRKTHAEELSGARRISERKEKRELEQEEVKVRLAASHAAAEAAKSQLRNYTKAHKDSMEQLEALMGEQDKYTQIHRERELDSKAKELIIMQRAAEEAGEALQKKKKQREDAGHVVDAEQLMTHLETATTNEQLQREAAVELELKAEAAEGAARAAREADADVESVEAQETAAEAPRAKADAQALVAQAALVVKQEAENAVDPKQNTSSTEAEGVSSNTRVASTNSSEIEPKEEQPGDDKAATEEAGKQQAAQEKAAQEEEAQKDSEEVKTKSTKQNNSSRAELTPEGSQNATEMRGKPSSASASLIIPTENWCTDETGSAIPCKEVQNVKNVKKVVLNNKFIPRDITERPVVYPKADVNGSLSKYQTWDQEKAKGSQSGPSGPDQWCTDGRGGAVPCKELESTGEDAKTRRTHYDDTK